MYKQLVVWLGTIVGKENVDDFEEYFKNEFGFRIKYHSEFKLLNEYETNCVLFYIYSEDISKFSIFRIQNASDLKWFEDFVDNNPSLIKDEIWELYDEYMEK